MPRVPRLTGPTIAPSIVREPTDTAASVGMPIAEAVVGAANRFAQIAQEEREKVLQTQVNEADVALRRVRDRLLYDQREGALTRQRTQAKDAPETFRQRWASETSSIIAGLPKDVQERVRQRAMQTEVEAESIIVRHATSELEKADAEYRDALKADALQMIVANPQDAALTEAKLAEAEALEVQGLRNQGFDQAVIDQRVATLRGQARAGQVLALLSRGDIPQAKAVFDAHREALPDVQRERIGNAIRTAEEGTMVEREAMRILSVTQSPTERNELIAALPIGMRKGVRDLVNAEQNAAKQARELEQENAFAEVEQAVTSGIPLTDPRLAVQVSLLSTTQRQTLERYAMAPINDNKAWMEWYQLASDPAELAKLTESEFRSYWSRLSTAHRDDAERDYRAARQAPSGSVPSYVTPQTAIARAMRTLGGVEPFAPLSEIDPDKQAQVVRFEQAASREIAAMPQAQRDNPVEVQKVLDRMLLQYVRDEAQTSARLGNLEWRGRTRQAEARGFEMTPSDTTGIFAGTTRIRLDQIPADAISAVDNILRTNRVPVTERNREAVYTIQRFDLDGSRLLRWLNDNRR